MDKNHDFADELPSAEAEREKNDPLTIAERIFGDMLGNLQTLKDKSDRPIELRSSGLPFCGLKKFILDERGESYSMDHYTSTGTAIHETLQKWFPKGDYKKYIFGDWKCEACNRVKKFQKLPSSRCKCGESKGWKYQELSLKYKSLTGHVDFILELPTAPVSYLVVDFKTTDMERKRSNVLWDPNQPSSKNYVVQIRTYCCLLQLKYKLNIRCWIVANINRAEPIRDKRHYHILSGDWEPKMSKRWLPYLDKAVEDFTRLRRLLRHLKEKNVDEAQEALINLVKGRPCQSEEDYKKWMSYAFYGKDECPMKKTCCHKGSKAVQSEVKERLRQKQ